MSWRESLLTDFISCGRQFHESINLSVAKRLQLEQFKKYCSRRDRFFSFLASFRLSHRPLRACSIAKASPEPKNPRFQRPHYFLKCSNSCGNSVGSRG